MMKIIKFIGIIALACFSFYYTEKSMVILKEKDPIMIKIKQVAKTKIIEPVSAEVNGDYIIPGINGMVIDVDESYKNMKKYGVYSESKLIYKEIIPSVTISNNYNKYITSGNQRNSTVSLVFKVYDTKYLDSIIEILDKNSTVGNFFIDSKVFEDNPNLISNISKKHHIYIIEEDLDTIVKTKNKFQSLVSNKFIYCLSDKENKNLLKTCKENKMKTIIPNIKTTKNIFSEVRTSLNKGNIISFNLNKNTVDELELVIKFIKSKGYTINNLEKQLSE